MCYYEDESNYEDNYEDYNYGANWNPGDFNSEDNYCWGDEWECGEP